MVAPTTSWPCSTRRAAATELSTPPDMATRTRELIGRPVGRPAGRSTPTPEQRRLLPDRLTDRPPDRLSAPTPPPASALSRPLPGSPLLPGQRHPYCSPGQS